MQRYDVNNTNIRKLDCVLFTEEKNYNWTNNIGWTITSYAFWCSKRAISFCFEKVLRNWVGLPVVFSHKQTQGVKNALIRVLSQPFTCPTTLNPTTKGLKILHCYDIWLQKINWVHDVILVTLVLSKIKHMRWCKS